ncbi:MAG: hypothetical protein WAN46_04950 [Gammaproteobacteria bacterium]
MNKPITIPITLTTLAIGGGAGFYISRQFFPSFDYGYTKDGGNKIVTRLEHRKPPQT